MKFRRLVPKQSEDGPLVYNLTFFLKRSLYNSLFIEQKVMVRFMSSSALRQADDEKYYFFEKTINCL